MNKAMIFPIHKKWVDKIFKGEKDYDFRNKLPKHLVKGMKIYFYETKGKVITAAYTMGPYAIDMVTQEKHYVGNRLIPAVYEGQGMIIGEAVVGEIYSDFAILRNIEEMVMIKTGWNNHFYAIELTNVIKYDNDWQSEQLSNLDYDWVEEPPMIKKIENAPSEPIAKEEFILWNKLYADTEGCIGYPSFSFEENNFTKSEIDYYKLTHPPQAPIYVVEREVL